MERKFTKLIVIYFLIFFVSFSVKNKNACAKPLKLAIVDMGILGVEPEVSIKFTSLIRSEFLKYKRYSVVSHEDVDSTLLRKDIFTKQRLKQYECTFVPCAVKVARHTKSNYTIIGRFIKKDKNAFVSTVQIVNVVSRRIEYTLNFSFHGEENFSGAASSIVERLDMWFPREDESAETIKKRREKLAKRIDEDYRQYWAEDRKKNTFKHKLGECPPGMILIPAGTFKYGSLKSDSDRYDDEAENELVYLDEYCMDMYEFPNKKGVRPLVKQEWFGAKASCEEMKKNLCSEKQWEKVCKGPQNTAYPYGDKFEQDKCNTPYIRNGKTMFDRKLAASGKYGECKSGYGVYDMSGNVYEWTNNSYEGEIYRKVIRGGSWFDRKTKNTRCATKNMELPFAHDATIGFRCCLN